MVYTLPRTLLEKQIKENEMDQATRIHENLKDADAESKATPKGYALHCSIFTALVAAHNYRDEEPSGGYHQLEVGETDRQTDSRGQVGGQSCKVDQVSRLSQGTQSPF